MLKWPSETLAHPWNSTIHGLFWWKYLENLVHHWQNRIQGWQKTESSDYWKSPKSSKMTNMTPSFWGLNENNCNSFLIHCLRTHNVGFDFKILFTAWVSRVSFPIFFFPPDLPSYFSQFTQHRMHAHVQNQKNTRTEKKNS